MKNIVLSVAMLYSCLQPFAQVQKIRSNETPAVKKQAVMASNPNVLVNTIPKNNAYDFSSVRICVDLPSPSGQLPPRINTAGKPIPKINSDGSLSNVAVTQQGLVSATEKMWNPGDVITVYLSTSNGSEWIRNRVMRYAREWEKYANIKFDFISSFNDAKIKVSFKKDGKSWSWVGRDVLFNPFKKYTMNFGWFDESTAETEFSRTVIHEFGHALGFHHEHQSPAAPLQWDLQKTYQYFKDEMNWTADDVNLNIINKYSQNNSNYSAYDPYSIMHYYIPNSLLLNSNTPTGSTGGDYTLSVTDKKYAGFWYPFPPKGARSQGNLRTNDDCDDVWFTVEYDVVPTDKVEFILSLGENNSRKVTWWKQIGVPLINNTETFLQVQNHSLILEENKTTHQLQIPFSDININKGISFWKAKLLGIHTPLNYKWNVLPAIRGGCRIRLTWNRDSCL